MNVFFLMITSPPSSTLFPYTTLFRSISMLHSSRLSFCRIGTQPRLAGRDDGVAEEHRAEDRKSTRLNSSHGYISYAVFCLKKKNPELRRQNSRIQRYSDQLSA